MVDRGLVAAAAGFAGATAFGAFVSVRENMPGEPLGLHLPGRVPFHLRLGLGSGLSAPWPMPVAAIVAALRSRPGQTWPGRVCAAVGAILLGGTVVEPATWGLRSRAPLVSAAVALNLISGGALMMAGRRAATTRALRRFAGRHPYEQDAVGDRATDAAQPHRMAAMTMRVLAPRICHSSMAAC
jgi:hypothetical protein